MMEDKFIVKNKSGTFLNIPSHKIKFAIDQEMDLVKRLNKTTADIKRDKDILREISFNNLEIKEEYDSSLRDINLDQKIDRLITILSDSEKVKEESPKTDVKDINYSTIEDIIKNQLSQLSINTTGDVKESQKKNIEEEMREQALMELLKKEKSYKVSDDFGKERKINKGDQEDYSDIIDF